MTALPTPMLPHGASWRPLFPNSKNTWRFVVRNLSVAGVWVKGAMSKLHIKTCFRSLPLAQGREISSDPRNFADLCSSPARECPRPLSPMGGSAGGGNSTAGSNATTTLISNVRRLMALDWTPASEDETVLADSVDIVHLRVGPSVPPSRRRSLSLSRGAAGLRDVDPALLLLTSAMVSPAAPVGRVLPLQTCCPCIQNIHHDHYHVHYHDHYHYHYHHHYYYAYYYHYHHCHHHYHYCYCLCYGCPGFACRVARGAQRSVPVAPGAWFPCNSLRVRRGFLIAMQNLPLGGTK